MPDLFPRISVVHDIPALISNAIIEINSNSPSFNHIKEILQQLIQLGCKALEIRIYDHLSRFEIINLESALKQYKIDDVMITLPKSETSEYLVNICKNIVSVKRILLHENEAGYDRIEKQCHILSVKKVLRDNFCHKKTTPELFTINIDFFSEAQKYNICLNKKVCVNMDGDIKNCPSFKESYGNIADINISQAIKNHDFKVKWKYNKDRISICNICEFRYMCFDCRANAVTPLAQPKCDYNPYIAKWEGEKGYVPVEACGSYGRETGYVPDHEKIKALNRQIWGEEG